MLKAFYTCDAFHCQALSPGNVYVEVRERRVDESVCDYLNEVARVCGLNHRRVSPDCLSIKLNIGLPMSQNGIGFPGPELTEQDKKELAEQFSKKTGSG